jgi:hypothetical protein
VTQTEYIRYKYNYDPLTGIISLKESKFAKLIGKQMGKLYKPHGVMSPYIRFQLHNGKDTEQAKQLGLPNHMFAHRAAWIISYGDIPDGYQIDHIDHDGTNNKLENLRCVTAQENQRNRKLDVRNKSGMNGIRERKNGKFEVSTKTFGKYTYIGSYCTLDEAIAARDAFYLAEGNFHQNHGLLEPQV